MRISDWSSDVCSSDLRVAVGQAAPEEQHGADSGGDGEVADGLVAEPVIAGAFLDDVFETAEKQAHRGKAAEVKALEQAVIRFVEVDEQQDHQADQQAGNTVRSEEHTSELQSLMRLTYAVFCLKQNQYTVSK